MKTQPTTDSVWSQLSGDLRRLIRGSVADEHVAEDLPLCGFTVTSNR
ncbi:MAG: hypothetical protein H6821_09980 [Planctomycetaceae bacterium]|nr:hypothetical protein [Planctomycetales bacterium]MCB9874492.1 hypothetical protein [Planctomycetaceae bacterium]